MRELLEKKTKSGKTYGQCIGEIVWVLVCAFFFSQAMLNCVLMMESGYQTHKDYYILVAGCFFLLALFPAQKVRFASMHIYVFAAVYTLVAILWLKKNEFPRSPDINNILRARSVYWGIQGMLLVDLIANRKILLHKGRNWVGTLFFFIPMLIALIISKGNYKISIPVFIALALFFQRFSAKTWKRWFFSFSLGYYAIFVYVIVRSFNEIPYTGERYGGIYGGTYGGALLPFALDISLAFLCALWWMILLIQKRCPLWQKLLGSVPIIGTILCPMICVVMCNNRTTEVAMIVMLGLVFVVWGGKRKPKHTLIRLAIVLVLFLGIGFIGYKVVVFLLEQTPESMAELFPDEKLYNYVIYWHRKVNGAINLVSTTGIFPDGSYWNMIDRFLGTRISFWIVYFRNLNWFGHASMENASIDWYYSIHPHNQTLYWSYGLGSLAGILLTVWQIYFLVSSGIKAMKGYEEYTLSFLCIVFFTMTGITETIYWTYPFAMTMIILYYPVLRQFDKKRRKKQKRKISGDEEKCIVKKEEKVLD